MNAVANLGKLFSVPMVGCGKTDLSCQLNKEGGQIPPGLLAATKERR